MKNPCPPTQTFSQERHASGIRQINGMETALTAGGVLLAKVVTGMFASDAQAAEPLSQPEPNMDDGAFDDSGDW
jgi:hypothetical protein